MARFLAKNIAGAVFLLFISLSEAALANYSVNADRIPGTVAPDARYNFSINYTTPDNIEQLDVLLSLKHPASGYTTYFTERRTVDGSSSGYSYYPGVELDGSPIAGSGYIWEIKFLQAGQSGESNPLFYYTAPATVKETGFVINGFSVPTQIEAYDSYDIEIGYLFDEGASATVTLTNDQTGEEVVKLTNLGLFTTNKNAVRTATTTLLNDPADGSYTWHLDVTVSRSNAAKLVYSESVPASLIYEDEIKSIDVVASAIAPGSSRDVTVAYTATQDRELMFELWSSNSSDYRVIRENVARGSGTITIPVEIPESVSTAHDYYWWSKIVPTGGQWWEFFDEKGTNAVVAANLNKAPFFEYPIYTFPGQSFYYTKYSSNYTVRVDEGLISGEAAIYVETDNSYSSNEYTLNLATGDLLVNKVYSSGPQVLDLINPYTNSSQLKEYRIEISAMISRLRTATEGTDALGDAFAYVESILKELNGESIGHGDRPKIYFDISPRIYDFDFTWRNAANHPDRIQTRTDGVIVGDETHVGLTINSQSTYGLILETLTFDLETGEIKKVVVDNTANVTTEESALPPYGPSNGDVEAYLALLSHVEGKLRKLTNGTKIGDFVLAKAYPQMGEYADYVLDLISKLTPIELSAGELFFGGNTTVFDASFESIGAGNHPTRWNAGFELNGAGQWEVWSSVAPGFPGEKIKAQLNLATGELYVLDETYGQPTAEYTLSAPSQGGDVEQYKAMLTKLIAYFNKVETQDLEYFLTRPQPQLKITREYLQAVLDSL